MTTPDETSPSALSHDTSLLTLFEAIVGSPPGRSRDRSVQVLEVEAQIRALCEELGLPDPAVPAAGRAADPPPLRTPEPVADGVAGAVHRRHDADRRSPFRALVAGLTTRRKYSVGMTALAATAGALW